MRKAQFKKINPRFQGKKTKKISSGYMADAFVQDDILAIDFYRSENKEWRICFRTLINEKEYWNFDYKVNIWSETKIDDMLSEMYFRYNGYLNLPRGGEKIYVPRDVRNIVNNFIEKLGGAIYQSFETTIRYKENSIAQEKRMNAEERKFIRIQEKMREAPDLPKDLKKFIEDKVYKDDHLLYYDKKDAYCSRCGSSTEKTNAMKHNVVGKCPVCRKRVRYKSIGRMSEHDERKEVLLIQEKDQDTILRYFKCSLLSTHKSKESLQFSESVRTYHKNGVEWFSNRYVCYVDMHGNKYWRDSMDPWHQVAYGLKTILYPSNICTMQNVHSALTLLPIEELANKSMSLPWKDILRGKKLRTEIFEKLYKAGLTKLAVEYMRNEYGIKTDYTQRELKKLLRISKPMLQYMQKNNSGKKVLEVLQDAFKNNCGLSNTEIFELAENEILVSELKKISEKNKIIKMLHYLRHVKGYQSLRSNYQHYLDYITMAKSMNYDLNNGTVRYPKDLKMAHDKVTSEFYEEETDKKKKTAMKKYPNIRNLESELRMRYGYENKEYLVVPPKNAGEIIEEGRKLHHCVGGDNYLSNHNSGHSFILFMRKKESPEKPYYTLEIDPKDNRIKQYYGLNDKKPDKNTVDVFLKIWKRVVNQRMKEKLAPAI